MPAIDGFYAHPSGALCERVTSITGTFPKPWLIPWAKKLPSELAVQMHTDGSMDRYIAEHGADELVRYLKGATDRARDTAADLGSLVHKAVEAQGRGEPWPTFPDEVAPYMRQFQLFVEKWEPKFLACEVEVYNVENRYAGTVDAICEIDGERWVLDVKTGKNTGIDHVYQVCAYCHATEALIGGRLVPMPEVAGAKLLHLRPRSQHLYDVPSAKDPEAFSEFLALATITRASRRRQKAVELPKAVRPADAEEALAAFGIQGETA